ncbi:MAG: ATP synthase F1 subunit delta [Syntrophorhabdaceae bacterium]|nr:ATP synthase F1 subunit delta [Syntrophorhabdaceae bacterium]
MISQSIAKRYANALFAVGVKDGKYMEYLDELEGILKLFLEEQRIGKALMLPIIEMEKRREILTELMRSLKTSSAVANLFTMLLEKNRMSYLNMIKDIYRELVDEKEGKVRGVLYTPYPVEDELKGRIEEELTKKFQKDVILNQVEDRGLIGGIKVMIKGTIIDGSVKRQLEILKENILKE